MKKAIPVMFAIFCLAGSAFGQIWYITRGLSTDEVAWAVDADSSGNVYWAVEVKDQWPYWYYNILLYKIDSGGQQVWQSNSWGNGTGFNDIAFKATVQEPWVYLSGRTDSTASPVSGDALVIRFSSVDGSSSWMFRYDPIPDYGYEEIDGLLVCSDGIYISGWKQQPITNDEDFLIQKIDLNGQLLFSNTWDHDSLGKFDGANGHLVMDHDFIYVAGHVNRTHIASFDGDGALVCFSKSNGDYQWHTDWGGASFDDALGMTMSEDSMIYVVGYTASYGNGSQAYINKYARSGQLQWSRLWGGTGAEITRCAVADGDSILYVIGTTSSYGNGGNDIFVLKIDSSGIFLDSLFWGGAYDEVAHDVARFGQYLYITGDTKSFGNGQIYGDHKTDGLLLKIDGKNMLGPDTLITGLFPELLADNDLIEIYPNPFTCHFWLSLKKELPVNDRELRVLDLSGRCMLQVRITENPQIIDCGNLLPGLYFLELREDHTLVGRKKIIRQLMY